MSEQTGQKQRGVHLVGSIPLEDAAQVIATANAFLGNSIEHVPDGETGVRQNFILWQLPIFKNHPAYSSKARDDDFAAGSLAPLERVALTHRPPETLKDLLRVHRAAVSALA